MSFAGWPGEAVEFFEDLEEDNTKSFWQVHIETYEISVKRPMEELLAELEPEFGRLHGQSGATRHLRHHDSGAVAD